MGIRRFLKRGKKHLKESYASLLLGGGVDGDEHLYRRLTGSRRDISPLTHERVLRLAYYLYETNPLARRIVELTKDFIIGDGISFTANDKSVKEVLDSFWNDPVNLWKLKQQNKALELCLYGEQIYPVFVNSVDGHVRLGYIDPFDVTEVATDPENCEIATEVVVSGNGHYAGQRRLKIINVDTDLYSRSGGMLVGDCFYFAVNKLSNSSRGRSDLQTLIDWMDAYDRLLFNRLDRAELINSFVWDVEIQDATEEMIDRFLRSNPRPRPGSIRVHNEKVKWNAVAPHLEAADASTEARLLRNQILGGAGIPEHWYAEGGDVNRATALEMGEPTFKRLAARQGYFKYMVEHIFQFVIDQAILHGTLDEGVDTGFQVVMPDLSVKDAARVADALSRITSALATAETQRWITRGTATKVFANIITQLGVDVDPGHEMEQIRKEDEKGPKPSLEVGSVP